MSDLITAIDDLFLLKPEKDEGEGERQLKALVKNGYSSQPKFFKDFHDVLMTDSDVAKKITDDDVVGLINMFGMALIRNFPSLEEKKKLFGKVAPSKKSQIKDLGKFDAPYTEALDAWGMPIDEVTMSANVASPKLVTPLGMVRAGASEPQEPVKKKKVQKSKFLP